MSTTGPPDDITGNLHRLVLLPGCQIRWLDVASMEPLRQLAEREHQADHALLLARVHDPNHHQLPADGPAPSIGGLFQAVEDAVDQAARITRPG